MIRQHRRLLLLLALFTVTALVYQINLPVLEGNDETHHFNYINWLRTQRTLPDRVDPTSSGAMQESGQPPLAYWITAVFLDVLNVPRQSGDVMKLAADARNPWSPVAERWRPTDNINLFLHGDNESAFGHPDIVSGVRAARLVSLAFLIIMVIGAYGAAREVFARESWALVTAAICGFVPLVIYTGVYITNDVGGMAFATLAIWGTLRLLRCGATPRRLLMIGVLIGLAALSKISTALITPGIGLALVYDWHQRRIPFRQFIVNGLLIALPAALLVGPWMLYGLITYRDPLGFSAYAVLKATNPNAPAPSVMDVAGALPEMYLSYWAKLGHAQVWLPPLAYALITGIIVLALVGYVSGPIARRRIQWNTLFARQMLVMLIMGVLLFLGLIRWLVDLWGVRSTFTGRLMYPAHAAIALLIAGGLYLLAQHVSRPMARVLQVGSAAVFVTVSVILTPPVITTMFGPPPMLTPQQLPAALRGGPIDFDQTIRFLGYVPDDPIIPLHSLSGMTACWEVLRAPTRPAAYAMKYFDDAGHTVGERTTIFGTGRYPSVLWKPGDRFCEGLDLPIFGPLEAGRTYNVILTVLDARTQASDWQPTLPDGRSIPIAAVGQVASPAGDMTATISGALRPTTITFPNFADLQGYTLDSEPGAGKTITLDLLWNARGTVRDDVSFFIHLVGAGTTRVLADGIPRGGKYPVWAWSVGEKIADRWMLNLPPDLPAGDYAIKIGFYHKASGERFAVSQGGVASADRTATLVMFQVK